MSLRLVTVLLTLVLVSSVGLGACGGDDDEDGAAGGGTATTEQTATQEEQLAPYVSPEDVSACIEGEGLDIRQSALDSDVLFVSVRGTDGIAVAFFGSDDAAEAKEYLRTQDELAGADDSSEVALQTNAQTIVVTVQRRAGAKRELAIVKKCARG